MINLGMGQKKILAELKGLLIITKIYLVHIKFSRHSSLLSYLDN